MNGRIVSNLRQKDEGRIVWRQKKIGVEQMVE